MTPPAPGRGGTAGPPPGGDQAQAGPSTAGPASAAIGRLARAGPIGWTARHPVVPNLVMLLLVLGGLIGALQMPRAVYPDFSPNRVEVVVELPGAGAEAINDSLVRRLEPAIAAVDAISRIRARAEPGEATISGAIAAGADPAATLGRVQAAVAGVTGLPPDARPPRVSLSGWRARVLSIAVHGPVPREEIRRAALQVRADLAAALPESGVELHNTTPRELRVEVPAAALRAHGLTLGDVGDRLAEALTDRPGGQIETRRGRLSVDVAGLEPDLAALRALPLAPRAGGGRGAAGEDAGAAGSDAAPGEAGEAAGERPRLGQIARLAFVGGGDAGGAVFDGDPVVKLTVFQDGAASVDTVAAEARAVLVESRARLPEAIAVTVAWDASEPLVERMTLIGVNGLAGLALVLLLLSLFLEIRLAFWVAVGIPTAFFGAFLLLPFAGTTINLVSLFAFILALGLVVDDAIVAGENIYEYRARGLAPVEAAVQGARDIAVPLSFSVITNMLAFIPLAMVPGWYGKFWVMIPVVVCLAFLISWLEALFVLPGHLAGVRAAGTGGGRRLSRPAAALARVQRATAAGLAWVVRRLYGPALVVAMRWRYATLALLVALVVVAAAWPVSGRMGFVLLPALPSDHVDLRVQMLSGVEAERVEAVRAEMVAAASRVAAGDGSGAPAMRHLEHAVTDRQVNLLVHLPPAETRRLTAPAFVRAFRAEMGPIPDAASTSFAGGGGGPADGQLVRVRLAHPDDGALEAAAAALADRLAGFEGVEDVEDSRGSGERRLVFRPSETGRALGFTETAIARQVRDAVEGRVALRLPDGAEELTVRVVRPVSERASRADLETLVLTAPGGLEAPLAAVADIREEAVAREVRRVRGARTLEIEARIVDGRVLSTVVAALGEEILPALMRRHPGLEARLAGREEAKRQTLESFPVSIGLTLALMYGALAIPFRSWWQPLIVLATIPFGAAGAIAGHLIMGKGLSVVSLFGMIALGGVVINAALVMVDYANKARAAGHDPFEAMRLAGERRFRPIMLTMLTTFGGLAPMIFDTSRSAAFLVPIAISMGYGIVFATAAVIFLVPCLWMVLEDVRWLANPRPRPIEA